MATHSVWVVACRRDRTPTDTRCTCPGCRTPSGSVNITKRHHQSRGPTHDVHLGKCSMRPDDDRRRCLDLSSWTVTVHLLILAGMILVFGQLCDSWMIRRIPVWGSLNIPPSMTVLIPRILRERPRHGVLPRVLRARLGARGTIHSAARPAGFMDGYVVALGKTPHWHWHLWCCHGPSGRQGAVCGSGTD